jgi:hypothetical protein
MVQTDSTRKPALGQEAQLGYDKLVDLRQCLSVSALNMARALQLV